MRLWSDSREAGFEAGRYFARYSDNVKDSKTGDWCFTLTKGGREVFRMTNAELLAIASEETPIGMLMAGMTTYMASH